MEFLALRFIWNSCSYIFVSACCTLFKCFFLVGSILNSGCKNAFSSLSIWFLAIWCSLLTDDLLLSYFDKIDKLDAVAATHVARGGVRAGGSGGSRWAHRHRCWPADPGAPSRCTQGGDLWRPPGHDTAGDSDKHALRPPSVTGSSRTNHRRSRQVFIFSSWLMFSFLAVVYLAFEVITNRSWGRKMSFYFLSCDCPVLASCPESCKLYPCRDLLWFLMSLFHVYFRFCFVASSPAYPWFYIE